MIADMLTKGLTRVKFENLRKMARVVPIIKQSEKEFWEVHLADNDIIFIFRLTLLCLA